MAEANRSIHGGQDEAISAGLRQFSVLPGWLSSAKDHGRTCQILSEYIPEVANGSMSLRKCRIGHMLLKGGTWKNTCILKVGTPIGSAEQTLEFAGILFPPGSPSISEPSIEGSFGAEGWHAIIPDLNLELWTPEPEAELESFQLLMDPVKSREFLERSLRDASPAYHSLRLQSCKPQIIRYKRGNRCTILYEIEYDPDMPAEAGGPAIVVAKTYLHDKGKIAYEGMKALWDTSFGSRDPVRIPEPLAYDAGLRVFLQGPVREEQTLADLLHKALDSGEPEAGSALNRSMERAAAGLAELHMCGVKTGQLHSWDDEIAEVKAQVAELSVVFPDLAAAAQPFLERICQLEAAAPVDALVPSHGTFRPAQVLLSQDEMSFIDFDSFCQSEPARDISMFLASLMTLGSTLSSIDKDKPSEQTIADPEKWESRFQQVYSIGEQFIEAYRKSRPVSRQRVALWEALDLFNYVLSGWMKVKAGEIGFLVKLLDRFLIASGLLDSRT